MKKIFVMAMAALALLGCEEQIKDGKIPEQYRETAKQYEGDFNGQFDGKQMTLTFKVEDSGRANLSVRDFNGKSELVSNCSAQIGQLIAVDVRSSDKSLRSARFAFNGRACGLIGDYLTVEIESSNNLELYIAEGASPHHKPDECFQAGNGWVCRPGGVEWVVDRWLTGVFVRK